MKKWFLYISKYLGLFRLTEVIYRRHLNILCYHGFSYSHEHEFRPNLFISRETFEKRLSWLNANDYRVVSLEEGESLLARNELAPKTIVITIDDGFKSTLDVAAPLLKRYSMPATVYVTSYHAQKQTPIFRMVMLYFAWRAGQQRTKSALFPLLGRDWEHLMDGVKYAENELEELQRVELAKAVADELEINYQEIVDTGILSLMNEQQIEEIAKYGIDVQLHTHRHVLPQTQDGIEKEIADNRRYLEPIVRQHLKHFCYPCGYWEEGQIEPLQALGVVTATTCEPGMNSAKTHPLALKRFLDYEGFDQIEFEAEMRGFKELMRNLRDVSSSSRGTLVRVN